MNTNKFTHKLQEALQEAQHQARRHKHGDVDGEHLLLALLEQEEGVLPRIVRRLDRADEQSTYEALERYGLDLVAQARAGRLDPVIGRDEAIRRIVRILSRKTKNNPVLIGEPGVGKTELAKALAQALFDAAENMVRLDMSEYMEKHSVSKLLGWPCGQPLKAGTAI